MTKIQELDRHLEISVSTGIGVYDDQEAIEERLRDWMETPQGTVADNPSYGNSLAKYKFLPIGNVDTLVLMELDILEGLKRDIEYLVINEISAVEDGIDLIKIYINFGADLETEVEYNL